MHKIFRAKSRCSWKKNLYLQEPNLIPNLPSVISFIPLHFQGFHQSVLSSPNVFKATTSLFFHSVTLPEISQLVFSEADYLKRVFLFKTKKNVGISITLSRRIEPLVYNRRQVGCSTELFRQFKSELVRQLEGVVFEKKVYSRDRYYYYRT